MPKNGKGNVKAKYHSKKMRIEFLRNAVQWLISSKCYLSAIRYFVLLLEDIIESFRNLHLLKKMKIFCAIKPLSF
jgi:hypothetical protein